MTKILFFLEVYFTAIYVCACVCVYLNLSLEHGLIICVACTAVLMM